MRESTARALPRTQECTAVSGDGERWALLNASPEIRAQIESFPALHPRAARGSPIEAVVLSNADLDHTLGLLSLREGTPMTVYATESAWLAFSEQNRLCRALDRVRWCRLRPGRDVEVAGLSIRPFCVPGKPPRYLESSVRGSEEDNIGLLIEDGAARQLVYAPSVGHLTPELTDRMKAADCVFFDGTFWSSEELVRHGYASRRAEDMAHLPIGGVEGSLRSLAELRSPRRVYIHVNNTNPVLIEDSVERAAVASAGWEVAWDGMEIAL